MKTIKNFLLRKILFKKGVKVLKNKKGFSLIEIMVGLGLLIIIGGIASTQYKSYTDKAKKGAVNATLSAISRAVGVCIAGGTDVATCLADGDVNDSISEKAGVAILHTTESTNTCFYAVQYDANGTAPSTKITANAIYGVEVFQTSDGIRQNSLSKKAGEVTTAVDPVAGDCTP